MERPGGSAQQREAARPEHFKTFPAHHFFVRIYRHNAVSATPPWD